MAKFCSNCGHPINEEQDVCLNCGVFIHKNRVSKDEYEYEDKDPLITQKAFIGFILGLVSTVAWILPLLGLPVTICGIVWSSKGLDSIKNHKKAIIGLTLNIVFLVISLINSIVIFLWMNS